MEDIYLLLASVVVTFVGVVLVCFAPSRLKSYVNLLCVALIVCLTSVPAIHVICNHELNSLFQGTFFFGAVPVRMDALSAWFVLIINLTCLNGALYGIGYMKTYNEQKNRLSLHWAMFLLFHASMLWVCMLQHAIAFLTAWEIMSLSSLMLVIFEHTNTRTIKAGINYLVQMHVGVVFLSVAFIWVAVSTGSFDFDAIRIWFSTHDHSWLFLLFFIGFGIKAGFLSLHTWLPEAHPAAPSHVSAVMSGVIVKLGIYGILRIIGMLQHDFFVIGEAMLLFSIATGLYGILNAAMHRNFKKMLAYCTIENIGIIGMGMGLGLIGIGADNSILVVTGFGASLLHVLNHSLFKSLLFFSAGSVYQQTHSKNMEKLGGLIKYMPQTALFFLIGAVAIGGMPPFNGFVSEFMLYHGFLVGIKDSNFYVIALMVFSIVALALIGGVSLLTFTKSFGVIFLGSPRSDLKHIPEEVSLIMRIPQYIIVLVMLSIAFFPGFYLKGANVAAASVIIPGTFVNMQPSVYALSGNVASVGIYSFLFCMVVVAVIGVRFFFKKKQVAAGPTWGCAYVNPNPSMQYTGKGFSRALGKLMGVSMAEKRTYIEIHAHEIFPEQRNYFSNYNDIFGLYLSKLKNLLIRFMNYFQFIQNGNMQGYILYGISFIILVFLATLFNIM